MIRTNYTLLLLELVLRTFI